MCFAAALIAVATSSRAQRPAGPISDTTQIGFSSVTKDSALEARTSAVASQLRCPICQGLSIQDSPSDLSQQMRSLVRDQLAAGKTPDEVKAYFVSKYGEWILLAPKPSGFNLLAYALPIGVVVIGGLGIFVAVRRWTGPAPEPTPGPDPAALPAHNSQPQ
ncbi:MAG: cytochrome c-type biogenesis protein [Gemmatimonadaceae bacterium]